MDNSIKQWLKQAKDAGLSDEQITQKLLEQGWAEEKVARLFNQSGYIKTKKLAKPEISFKLLVIGILLLFFGILISWPGTTAEDFSGLLFIIPGFTLILIGAFFIVGATNKTLISIIIYSIIGVYSYFLYPSLKIILRQDTPRRDDEELLNFVLLAFGFTIIFTSIIIFYKFIFKRIHNPWGRLRKIIYKRRWILVIVVIIVMLGSSVMTYINFYERQGPDTCYDTKCNISRSIYTLNCNLHGGELYQNEYLRGESACGKNPTSDAGKQCTASSECEAECVIYSNVIDPEDFECSKYQSGDRNGGTYELWRELHAD